MTTPDDKEFANWIGLTSVFSQKKLKPTTVIFCRHSLTKQMWSLAHKLLMEKKTTIAFRSGLLLYHCL